jgi:O-antigen/teichoic acid export membrane protein
MKMHQENRELYERKNRRLYAIVFYISCAVSFVICLFADPIIHILYRNAYEGAVVPLRIVVWYTAFSYLGVARNTWMVCENKQKYLTGLYAAAALLNVIMNAFLIPVWGGAGAALASLITQISTTMIIPLFIKELRPNTRMLVDAILLRDIL